jgi:hypothetical protein
MDGWVDEWVGEWVNGWMDLLTPYTHHSELQAITALSLITTLYKSPQHSLSSPSLLSP